MFAGCGRQKLGQRVNDYQERLYEIRLFHFQPKQDCAVVKLIVHRRLCNVAWAMQTCAVTVFISITYY
jgi:ribulose bisphosphate carboxylase small subunit